MNGCLGMRRGGQGRGESVNIHMESIMSYKQLISWLGLDLHTKVFDATLL